MGNTSLADEDDLDVGCMGPKIPLFDQENEEAFRFSRNPTDEIVSKNKNFGISPPLIVIHNILMFLTPSDLLSMMLTCQIFSLACNNDFFWSSYYKSYFGDESEGETLANMKLRFYQKFFCNTDAYYRRKYRNAGLYSRTTSSGKMSLSENQYKVTLAGEYGVGKTSYLKRLLKNEFHETVDEKTSYGLLRSYKFEYDVRGNKTEPIILDLCDMIGFERMSPQRFYFRNSSGSIVLFSITSIEHFRKAQMWVKEIRSKLEEYGQLENIVLVGSKCDLEKEREVDYEINIKPYLEKEENKNMPYVEISSKENVNINKVLGLVIDQMIKNERTNKK